MNKTINYKLTKEQREILVGCILGDLDIQTRDDGKTFHCYFELEGSPTYRYKEYVFHLYDCFKNLCPSGIIPKFICGKVNSWAFETQPLGTFSFYGNLFYPINVQTGQRKKRLPTRPNLLKKLITPLTVAYWYMGNGSLKSKQSRTFFLNTQKFSIKEVQLLCDILKEKFDLKAKPYKQESQNGEEFQIYYQIVISPDSFEQFSNLVAASLHSSMLYKWPYTAKTK